MKRLSSLTGLASRALLNTYLERELYKFHIIYMYRERQTDRQRQTETNRDRQTEIETDRQKQIGAKWF